MSRRSKISLALLLVVSCGALVAALFCQGDTSPMAAGLSVTAALGGDTTGYARANTPASISLPADHGPHPRFRTEWWYFTGNVECADGSPMGYQFTVFRTALTPRALDSSSPWRTNQLYSAHVAISDISGALFRFGEKVSRGAVGLAGAQVDPFRVWVEDWEIRESGDPMLWHIAAGEPDFGIALQLRPTRSPVFHGDRGWSPKSNDARNASYYYSFTRMRTTGRLLVSGRMCDAVGTTWMDHEWSTSALGPTQVGWDWFALRLSNGDDLMYFQVREQDSATTPFVEGTIVAADGTTLRLDADDVRLTVSGRWTSSKSRTEYPAGWVLDIPSSQTSLQVDPMMADQELRVTVRYWEGAVRVRGIHRGKNVSGEGYVELTGYGEDRAADISGKQQE